MAATTARRRDKAKRRTAVHRPATRRRRFAHDDLIAVDLFSGFGGLTRGIEAAGFTTIMAANHNAYKVEVHEANHPNAEHWLADLVDPEASDYHSARDLPAADILVAGVSCVNHTQANTQKAYEQRMSLFDLDDPEFEARVTRSERDRATANCVLHYAEQHHPRMILVECTTELTSWGPAIPGKPTIGDGTTYRWWLKQFVSLNYRYKVLYLNSMFFGVPQSRNRIYIVFWDASLPTPDLDHRPPSWCGRCSAIVPAVWSWKTGIPLTGSVSYGKQYNYRCPRCRVEVIPPMSPSINALDLTNLGTRIGDKPVRKHRDGSIGPLALATLARAERCRQRFVDFPAILLPKVAGGAVTGQVIAAHRHNGDGQHIGRPMDTVTTTHEKALLLAAVNNYQGSPRGVSEPLPTQGGSETLGVLTAGVTANRENATSRSLNEPMATMVGNAGSGGIGLLSTGVVPFRRNTVPTTHTEPMPTVTAAQTPGLLTAAGTIKNNGCAGEAKYRAHPVSDPLGTVTAQGAGQAVLFSGWTEQDDTSAVDAEWRAALAAVPLEDCYFRMLAPHEVGRGCGFDVDFPGHQGSFVVWGSARDQIDGYGNAVSPEVGRWIGLRLRAVLHGEVAA
ncbi:DNA cytosine methyltransferase [Verrucosispora sp. WMMC514]|uniref:DNA cytosine methyltransferase n=1 Tax=Verrucosispora sp. WMMC514 TaxID=3015156 RepID=UPI00248C6C1E|nr:DNA cytosine methyltransferase [Verrucosispora sp. WMMC514]WBB94227.1 DNA cytosine methyltransferase [Verrucosispora sp. WMMC514]